MYKIQKGLAGSFTNNCFSAMMSEDDDIHWGEGTHSGFDYSEDEEDSGYSDYNISDVDFEVKVFDNVTKFRDQFANLELEEDVKEAAEGTEDPTLNNKKATEDKRETTRADEETEEDMEACEIPGEDRKTEDILPGDCIIPCSSSRLVVFPLLFKFPLLFLFPFLYLFPFPFLFLLLFQFLIPVPCSCSSSFFQVVKMFRDTGWLEEREEPGDSYDADTEDSEED